MQLKVSTWKASKKIHLITGIAMDLMVTGEKESVGVDELLQAQSFPNLKVNGEKESVGVDELLQAQALVWNHTFRFISSFSVKCAIQLEIPDTIHSHGQPMTISNLASALSIHSRKLPALYRLMRILVQSGFFTEEIISTQNDKETKGYALTHASRLLLKDNPYSARALMLAMLDPVMMKPWEYIGVWFQDNEDSTPFTLAYGMSRWEYAKRDPRQNHLFNEAMACDGLFTANVLLGKCKGVFEGLTSLVDVGGGKGTITKALAKAFPDTDWTVFDLPHVIAGLQGSENLKFVGGSMFDEVPTADAVLMKWIIHDWGDEESVEILKKCKEAIIGSKDKGGKVIIIDVVIENKEDEEKSKETKLFFDLQMMVSPKGKERSEQEWSQLFTDAGFGSYKIHNVLGLRSVIEVFP